MLVLMTVIMQEVTVQVPQVASLYLINSTQFRSHHFYIADRNQTVADHLVIPPPPEVSGRVHGGHGAGDGGHGGDEGDGGDGGDIWCGMLSAGPVTEDLILRAIKHASLNPGVGVSQ